MKQTVLGYEQKFFINGTQISGVQNVAGSYAIEEKPINVLGWGHVSLLVNLDQKHSSDRVHDNPLPIWPE